MNVFVGRQPIFTVDKKVFGYELLFRSGNNNVFPDYDGDTATSQVLSNTFFSEGANNILRGKPGFVNFTRNLICDQVPLVLPKSQVFIEVLENVEPEADVLESLILFKKKGYVIVLDDFMYDDKFKDFMDLCDIIKFDLINTPVHTIKPLVDKILAMKHITLLAEKVESYEEFIQAKENGFKLFQGYFFAKPEIISQKALSTHQGTKLRLLSETRKSDPDLDLITNLIKVDISLSFKLLKLINSSYFRRRSSINTIKDAIIVIGLEHLRKFINIAVVGDINPGKPNELTRLSIIRGSLCEQIGGIIDTDFTSDELFTVGLFSLMDAMLDIHMKDFISQVHFSQKMTMALMGNNPHINDLLDVAIICEGMSQRGECFFSHAFKDTDIISVLPKFYENALTMADSLYISET